MSYGIKRGFTLIELLVVIAIIGILAAFVVASFTSAQKRGRDSRRKSDLNALSKALELAKTDSISSRYYPYCFFANIDTCPPAGTNPSLDPTYIKKVPKDPKNDSEYVSTNNDYQYIISPSGCGNLNTCTGYTLTACLENDNEQLSLNVIANDGTCATRTKMFRVSNP